MHGRLKQLAGFWQYRGCREDLLALAAEYENTGTATEETFNRLLLNESPYADSARKAVVRYIAEGFLEAERQRPDSPFHAPS